MASFQRPFNPDSVTTTTIGVSLPDRREDTSGVLEHFARYPKRPIHFLSAEPLSPAVDIQLSWPVSGTVRLVDLLASEAAGLAVPQLMELSPLPFAIAPVLRALDPGLPTFYIGFGGAALPEEDTSVLLSNATLTVTRAVIGCMFQDRMTLEPWAWIDLIGDALEKAAPSDAPAWRSLASLFDGRRTIQVRDWAGRPVANQVFEIRFSDSSGTVLGQTSATSNATGDLGQTAFPLPGEKAEIIWQPEPLAGDQALPVVALYEPSLAEPDNNATRSYPGESPLTIHSGFTGAHLQLLDLARWYAPAVVSPEGPWPARFRAQSHVEPLVDGVPTYTRLVKDIRLASAVHMAGWAFAEFPMRPYDPTSSLGELVDSMGRDKFRILVANPFNVKQGALNNVGTEGLLALFTLMLAAEPFIAAKKLGEVDDKGLLVWFAAMALVLSLEAIVNPDDEVEAFLRKKVDFTKEPMRRLLFDKNRFPCAFPAPHPVSLADNPIGHHFSVPGFGNLSEIQELWGIYHDKLQVIAKPEGTGTAYVGYVGGIDINSNRVDAPGHHAARFREPDEPPVEPYHDVHARVTGPAAFDLVGHFHDRYKHAVLSPPPEFADIVQDPLFQPAMLPPPAFLPPDELPAPAGQHLARIARTAFKPAPGREGLPWAPNGDASIRETFERAIRSAREYIYIEEQYFTLDNGLVEILRQAADHCQRLVVVFAFGTPDQIFGDERRLAILERLSGATGGPGGWHDRMIAGSPFRRSVLSPAEFTASIGGANLLEEVPSATESKIYVGPVPRVPTSVPYFFWVAGELMYATKTRRETSPGGQPSVEIEVLRGSLHGTDPGWCPHPRVHKRGAPVTFSSPKEIFVHAKLLMVDDIFVAIGSCNWNRRGFYHDGEVDVFAVPDRLKASRDNPAFLLRTALWAEQLGFTPCMGRSVLADPVEGFELFRRSRYAGNRFTPYREFVAPRGDLSALNDMKLWKLLPDSVKVTLLATVNAFTMTQVPNIWNTMTDPTTSLELNPTEGPELP